MVLGDIPKPLNPEQRELSSRASYYSTMSIVLYYHSADDFGNGDLYPRAEYFRADELLGVLKRTEELRRAGKTHVCISSENVESIGLPGVSSVENGKTPDGVAYDWKKRR